MGSLIDARDFYNRDDFTDVILQFDHPLPNEKIKCRKLILSAKSDYCRALFSDHGRFKESNSSVIQMKGDDNYAFKAMIRYIYTSEYDVAEADHPRATWYWHFETARVADQYGLNELEERARKGFDETANAEANVLTVIEILKHANEVDIQDNLEKLLTRYAINISPSSFINRSSEQCS